MAIGSSTSPASTTSTAREWLPWVIAAATCIVATTIVINYYGDGSLLRFRKSRKRNDKSKRPPRHGIDIDLSDPQLLLYAAPAGPGNALGGPGSINGPADVASSSGASNLTHRRSSEFERMTTAGSSGLPPSTAGLYMGGGNSLAAAGGGNIALDGYGVPTDYEALLAAAVSGGQSSIWGGGTGSNSLGYNLTVNGGSVGVAGFPMQWNIQPPPSQPQVVGLNPHLVRSIVERLLDTPPLEAPLYAFSQAVAGTSGKPAFGGRRGHSGLAIREFTELPPFHQQIQHIIDEIRAAKQPGKPLLIEGAAGLGKGTALHQYVAEQGQLRPALYLQLSMVLRKRHGASSVEDEDEDEYFTETETETEGLEERVQLTVRKDAWKKAVEKALGADTDQAFASPGTSSVDGAMVTVDMTVLEHIAQALRVIKAKSKAGPVMLVIDDVQLLFRERLPLTDKYEGIAEVFGWLLKCETEGILDVIMCSSDKSAVGAIKRLRGYDWGLTLRAVECVDDESVIRYLLQDVNPVLPDPAKKFTEDTAALFVATFDGSLLELDNYIRDGRSNVHAFIRKRERSFFRHLQRHLPARIKKPHFSPPTPSRVGYKPPTLSSEEELRELFLDIIMRGGVLPVARLDVQRMALVEALVERNILRWRDHRVRRRENRPSMRPGWVPPTTSTESAPSSDNFVDGPSVAAGDSGFNPSQAVGTGQAGVGGYGTTSASGGADLTGINSNGSKTSRIFGLSRPNNWFKSNNLKQQQQTQQLQPIPAAATTGSSDSSSSEEWDGPVVDDQWAGAVAEHSNVISTQDLDAAEQLALFAREGAELVWSNNLVRSVCESFVSGTQMQW
ncbi:hypothetical protein DFJ73DRAFT_835847 [Zopfochytrium polystomum]|nr:hypothetical protein DFJ73DRAFT_835847 [Zopfochytrium polystomum]